MHLLLKLAVCSLLSTALAARAADTVNSEDSSRAGPASTLRNVPDDAELQRLEARIGRIDIQVGDVFDDSAPLAAPYRLANSLHMTTHDDVVQAQLLFKSGDRFDRRVLDETERLLRQRRYLSDAKIETVRYNEDGTVDVSVRVRDVWTLVPGLSFSRKGGTNSTKIELEDTNLLGFGKEVSLERSSDVDRDSTRLRYRDFNLGGSRWQLGAAYLDSSDGSEQSLQLARPFYSLDSRWSLALDTTSNTAAVSRYSLGKVVQQFDQQQQQLDLGGGFSTGLHDGWAWRWLGGIHYEKHEFSLQPQDTSGLHVIKPEVALPNDRTLAYPWVGMELIEDHYRTASNLDQIGRTEDLFLGRSARFDVGLASTALGSTRDGVIFKGALHSGGQWSDRQYLSNSLEFHGRFEDGTVNDGLIDFTSRYHLRHSPSRVLYGAVNFSLASNLDPEQQLLLGGDSGLRGYPLRYQAGTARTLVTLEERFYTRMQLFKLFNVGAAVFFDAGRSWGKDDTAAAPIGWLKDVGVGLRLGSARSGLGNVLHIDLAYPLDGPRDLDRLQLLIGTHRSF